MTHLGYPINKIKMRVLNIFSYIFGVLLFIYFFATIRRTAIDIQKINKKIETNEINSNSEHLDQNPIKPDLETKTHAKRNIEPTGIEIIEGSFIEDRNTNFELDPVYELNQRSSKTSMFKNIKSFIFPEPLKQGIVWTADKVAFWRTDKQGRSDRAKKPNFDVVENIALGVYFVGVLIISIFWVLENRKKYSENRSRIGSIQMT